MSFAAKKWKVMCISPEANFDLQPEDVLDFTVSPIQRRRGESVIDWGTTIKYTEDQGHPKIFGRRGAGVVIGEPFEIKITPPPSGSPDGTRATHTGQFCNPGHGSRGTWEAQEGG